MTRSATSVVCDGDHIGGGGGLSKQSLAQFCGIVSVLQDVSVHSLEGPFLHLLGKQGCSCPTPGVSTHFTEEVWSRSAWW